jgi:ceramide glucosyltransferase
MIALVLWAVLGLFLASTATAAVVRYRPPRVSNAGSLPPCSIIVPIKGPSSFLAENMQALAAIEPFRGEILVSVAQEDDSALDVIRPLVSAHSDKMRLLVGEDAEFANPKLRNLAKAYRSSRHDIILFLDDSVELNLGIFAQLLSSVLERASAATAAPLGSDIENVFAEFEAATCTYLARLEMFLGLFGAAAAFGNALAFRKSDLEAVGGVARLAQGPCEDNALSKALHETGKRLILIRSCITRRIGRRTWQDIYSRHLRWKHCVRCHDPLAFFIEPFIGGLCFNLLGTYALFHALGVSIWAGTMLCLTFCYGIEALVHVVCGWQIRYVTPLAWLMRDIAHPLFTIAALFSNRIMWRGQTVEMRRNLARQRSARTGLS